MLRLFAREDAVGVQPVKIALEGQFVCLVDCDVSTSSDSSGIGDSAAFKTSEEELMMTLVWIVKRFPCSPSLMVTVSVRSNLYLTSQS